MTDGIDHINIYSKGQTSLGRSLSNFSGHRVVTLDGEFASMEGYWYWMGAEGPRREELRGKVGWEAKKLGRELRADDWNGNPMFKLKIAHAMIAKLILNPDIYTEFRTSTLPFRHYYVYGENKIELTDGQWIMELWEHLRSMVKTK